jgi:putative membrane protein
MIRSYNDHAANERTFLAWVRTGLSAIGLGIFVEKPALLTLVIGRLSAPTLADDAFGNLGNYAGPALIVTGLVVILGAGIRVVRTALLIDDQNVHSTGIVVAAQALSHRARRDSDATRCASPAINSTTRLKEAGPPNFVRRNTLTLVRSIDPHRVEIADRVSVPTQTFAEH